MSSSVSNIELFEPLQTVSDEIARPFDETEVFAAKRKVAVVALIFSLVPSLAIVVGLAFRQSCSMNKSIPQFMLVSGSCSLILIIGVTFVSTIVMKLNNQDKSNMKKSTLTLNILMYVVWIGVIILAIFLVVWTCLGFTWVLPYRNLVQFVDRTATDTYCHPVMYYTSLVYLVGSYGLSIFFCCTVRGVRYRC